MEREKAERATLLLDEISGLNSVIGLLQREGSFLSINNAKNTISLKVVFPTKESLIELYEKQLEEKQKELELL